MYTYIVAMKPLKKYSFIPVINDHMLRLGGVVISDVMCSSFRVMAAIQCMQPVTMATKM